MPEIQPYLFFDGNCAEAMRHYERVLGGKLELMTHADAPAGQSPPGNEDRVLHARLVSGNGVLMASDDMAGAPYHGMKHFFVSLGYTSAEEGRTIFDALAEGGEVILPYARTFWAAGFGMLKDKFGTPWMVSGQE